MDFKYSISNIFASVLIVCRNFIFLILAPYKTMRTISQEKDTAQLVMIFLLVLWYFLLGYRSKPLNYPAIVSYGLFVCNFIGTVWFFYILTRLLFKAGNWRSLVFTLSYTLLPTLIWFGTNSVLYILLPPPRTLSFLGRAFSIFFVSFSLSLLVWKTILVYLALRFSTGQSFVKIMYLLSLYVCIFLPYTILLYYLKLFRVPFI